MQKQCKQCGAVKPLAEFHRCRTVKDGRKARCRDCMNERSRAWRRENPEKHDAAVAGWRAANPEKVAASKAAWAQRNPDLIAESRARNAESRAASLAAWKAANREKVREYQRRRRAAGYGLPAQTLDLDALWLSSGGACGICAGPIDRRLEWPHPDSPSIDHILPLSMGGAHEQENAQWAHLACNLRKGNRPSETPALAAGRVRTPRRSAR